MALTEPLKQGSVDSKYLEEAATIVSEFAQAGLLISLGDALEAIIDLNERLARARLRPVDPSAPVIAFLGFGRARRQ